MLNSAAALFAYDIYRKHWKPQADDADLVRLGRWVVVVLVSGAALLAATTYDPASSGNFFLRLSRQISYLTPGLMVSFLMGMFSARATARGAVAAILAGPVLGFSFEWAYAWGVEGMATAPLFGRELNFMHRTFLTVLACVGVHAAVSRTEPRDPKASAYLFTSVTGTSPSHLVRLAQWGGAYLVGTIALAVGLVRGALSPLGAGAAGAVLTLVIFATYVWRAREDAPSEGHAMLDDRLLAGLLTASVTFVLFYFY